MIALSDTFRKKEIRSEKESVQKDGHFVVDGAAHSEQVYTLDELKECLFPVFRQYGIKDAILFGSYGKGTATVRSDVDLLVDSGLRGLRFVGFMESLRLALNGKAIDVFDVSHIEHGSRLETEIMQTGVHLYAE